MTYKTLRVPSTPNANGVSTVKTIDVIKISKIVASTFDNKLADVYYREHTEPVHTLDYAEAMRVINKCFQPDRCQWQRENACWWGKQKQSADPRCIRCSLAAIIQQKHGTDLRHAGKPRPGIGYLIAVGSLFAVTNAFSQNMQLQTMRANKAEATILKLKAEKEYLRSKLTQARTHQRK